MSNEFLQKIYLKIILFQKKLRDISSKTSRYLIKNFAISYQILRDILSKTLRYLIKNFAISYQKLRDILSKTYLGLHAMCLICFTILVKRLEFC